MRRFNVLESTKHKPFNRRVFGFDVETVRYPDGINDFYIASVYDSATGKRFVFSDKRDVIDFFKQHRFCGAFVVMTNAGFDFYSTFPSDVVKDFNVIRRGSDFICAKTHLTPSGFKIKCGRDEKADTLTFIDTLNYMKAGVEALGNMLDISKLSRPRAFMRPAETDEEFEELVTYNIRDAEISAKAFLFFARKFSETGANVKLTIASTSMSLFKNRFLGDKKYYRHPVWLLKQEFEAYYGGRCEAFARGRIRGTVRIYDVNSMYPSVMRNEFPDPNAWRVNGLDWTVYYQNYEGVTHAEVESPKDMKYPFLPCRTKSKLLFPLGTFTGWFSNVELRYAEELGYVIRKIYKNIYFPKKCVPFREYIDYLYKARVEARDRGDPIEKVYKLFMNSLYGKFGQKFTDIENVVHEENLESRHFRPGYRVERINKDFFRVVESEIEPPAFTVPIWAVYVTAYSRIELYKLIVKYEALYCDTDSVVIEGEIEESGVLGGLKCEMTAVDGIIVRPKFYSFRDEKYDRSKIKGLGVRVSGEEFAAIVTGANAERADLSLSIRGGGAYYEKLTKFKESIRRGFEPNQSIPVFKVFELEDTKRRWPESFSADRLIWSEPINIDQCIQGACPPVSVSLVNHKDLRCTKIC